jgi:hypothetical protein
MKMTKNEKISATMARLRDEQGVKWGSARPGYRLDAAKGGRKGGPIGGTRSGEVRRALAKQVYADIIPIVQLLRDASTSLGDIATYLNTRGYVTSRGKPFSPTAILRIYEEYCHGPGDVPGEPGGETTPDRGQARY